MEFAKYIKKQRLSLRVIPNAKQTKLVEDQGGMKLYLHAVPEDNKANLALIKFFKKEYYLRVRIFSGEKSREKVLEIKEYSKNP